MSYEDWDYEEELIDGVGFADPGGGVRAAGDDAGQPSRSAVSRLRSEGRAHAHRPAARLLLRHVRRAQRERGLLTARGPAPVPRERAPISPAWSRLVGAFRVRAGGGDSESLPRAARAGAVAPNPTRKSRAPNPRIASPSCRRVLT